MRALALNADSISRALRPRTATSLRLAVLTESQNSIYHTRFDVRTQRVSNRYWGPGTYVKCQIFLLWERGTQGWKDEEDYFHPMLPTIRLIWIPAPASLFSHGLEYHGLRGAYD